MNMNIIYFILFFYLCASIAPDPVDLSLPIHVSIIWGCFTLRAFDDVDEATLESGGRNVIGANILILDIKSYLYISYMYLHDNITRINVCPSYE
jgi:hypothetical protein